MGLHRFKRGDVVHAKKDLKRKGKGLFGMTETIVLEGMRGIVQRDQGLLDSRVPVEFVNGRVLEVSTDVLAVERKQFSLLP